MKIIGLIMLMFWSTMVAASHSFGGLDMCALYPEIMPPGLKTELLPGSDEPGSVLMQTYCTQCHALPGPGRHTAEEWRQVLDKMLTLSDVANKFSGLLGNIKTPSASERQQLSDYLERYALQSINYKPQGYGAAAFENHCAECHQLPDPAYYSINKWPDIIKRMQGNMTIMKYPLPSAETMMQIQFFLQRNNKQNQYLELNDTQKKATNQSTKFNFGSLLALGPFILLVMLGLIRWWLAQHKRQHA